MLEFLVLGQIPGTHIQITFAWYLFAALGLLSYAVRKVKRLDTAQKTTKQFKLFN